MRIRIIFKLKTRGAAVPFHHQQLLFQFIQELIKGNDDGAFSHFVDYNFSGLKGQTSVSKKGLHFHSSKITLVISSNNPSFLNFLVTTMVRVSDFHIGNLELQLESVEREELPNLEENVKYICISPMVIVHPKKDGVYAKKFLSPESDVFSDLVYESTLLRMKKSGIYTQEQLAFFYKFQIVPDKEYLKKIKDDEKKFARIYTAVEGREKFEIRGYTFPFTLLAAREVQQFAFECGLGAYTNKGYGMIDLANSNPVERSIAYEISDRINDLS